MEKTEFEIRESVKEHLDALRLDRGYQCQIGGGILHRKQDGRYRLRIGQVDLHLDDDALSIDFESAYRLLGLGKRDALEAAREKITNLEQQLEEAQNVKFEGMASPAWAMLGELTKFMEEALESDVPRMTNWRIRLEDGEEVTLMNIWAATSHDSPITRATELREMLDAEKEKSKRWESRAWKILKIVRRRETEQRPKTAAVLRTLREVSEKNEQLLAQLEEIKYEDEVNGKGWENNHNSTYSRLCRVLEAYKEGKKDE